MWRVTEVTRRRVVTSFRYGPLQADDAVLSAGEAHLGTVGAEVDETYFTGHVMIPICYVGGGASLVVRRAERSGMFYCDIKVS